MFKHLLAPLIYIATLGGSQTPAVASIQALQDVTGHNMCTTWSISEQQGYWATAAHCLVTTGEDGSPAVEKAFILHHPVVPVWVDVADDVAVLQASLRAPTLPLGPPPAVGDDVSITGYGLGFDTPTLFKGHVANLGANTRIGTKMLFGMPILSGDSGAPILDSRGRVVSMAQEGWGGAVNSRGAPVAGGPTWVTMQELKPYWGR